MIRRSAVIATELAIGLVAVVTLLVGLAAWRLSSGPVDLDFLTPEIEAALSNPDAGIEVRIGKTQLTWAGWNRTVDLHARDIRVRRSDGEVLAALPDVVIWLSLRALVQGSIAPTRAEVIGAQISLLRRQDGTFQFGPWEETGAAAAAGGQEEGDFSRLVPTLIARLLSAPTPSDPLTFLRVLRIAGGRVAVKDLRLGTTWSAPYADIELRRDAVGLAGELGLKLDLGGRETALFALFDYSQATKQIDLTARFSDLVPQAIVSIAPGLSAVAGLTMPLAGSVSATFSDTGFLHALNFDLHGQAGEFSHEAHFPVPIAVRSLKASGTVLARDRRMMLEEAVVELGSDDQPGPRVVLSGELSSAEEGFRGDLEVNAQASAESIDMAKLARYWPPDLAPNPRKWILENVPVGTTDKGTLKTRFTAPGGDFAEATLHDLGGTLDYTGIEVHFLRPMPPVTGIAGSADFDDDRITFKPRGGRLGTLELQESVIDITGLRLAKEFMTIEIPAVGPLRDALALLDHDRLKLIRKLHLSPESFQGQVAARVRFEFLLLKDLDFDDIDVTALANMEQVAAREILLGRDIENGRLKLALDKSGMNLTGPLTFAGIPMDVSWAEAFTEERAEQTRIEIKAPRVDAQRRADLGLAFEPYLSGPVSAHVIAHRGRDKRTVVEAALNLRDAGFEIAPINWMKAPGADGSATLTLELADDRAERISQLSINTPSLRARGSAAFDASGTRIARLDLSELKFNRTDLNGVAVELSGPGLGLEIGGGVLDATPWMADDPKDPKLGPDAPEDVPESEPDPLRLSAANLKAVYFGPDRYLEGVEIELDRSRGGWERILLNGKVPRSLWHSPKGTSGADLSGETPKTLRFEFGPGEAQNKRLQITAEDMGAALRALDLLDTVNGGRLEIVGTSDKPLPGGKLDGRIEGHDYVLVGAPNMARLLTIASLTGISDLLNGEGIGFQRLVGEFTFFQGLLHTELMRAYGPALGLTTKGDIDFQRDVIALRGTIVPAYTVNRILGGIPLLGTLLTGGKGEGMFAATYQVSGPVGQPELSVNPLSALAPGFLRSLFSSGTDLPEDLRAIPER